MNSGMGKTVVVGLVVLVALFIGLNYFSGPTEQSVEVTFPGGSALRLDASQPEIAHPPGDASCWVEVATRARPMALGPPAVAGRAGHRFDALKAVSGAAVRKSSQKGSSRSVGSSTASTQRKSSKPPPRAAAS